MIMTCGNCGGIVEANMKFCPFCGYKLKQNPQNNYIDDNYQNGPPQGYGNQQNNQEIYYQNSPPVRNNPQQNYNQPPNNNGYNTNNPNYENPPDSYYSNRDRDTQYNTQLLDPNYINENSRGGSGYSSNQQAPPNDNRYNQNNEYYRGETNTPPPAYTPPQNNYPDDNRNYNSREPENINYGNQNYDNSANQYREQQNRQYEQEQYQRLEQERLAAERREIERQKLIRQEQMLEEQRKSTEFQLNNDAKKDIYDEYNGKENTQPQPPTIGVGSASVRNPVIPGSNLTPRNPILPEDDDYDDDDYDYNDDGDKKSHKGLIFFLVFLIVLIASLIVLQLTGKVKLEELPSKVIELVKGESAKESSDMINGSEDIDNLNEVVSTAPKTVSPSEIATYKIGESNVFSNLQVNVKDVKAVDTYKEMTPDEGEILLVADIEVENVSSDPDLLIRYSPYQFKLLEPTSEKDRLPKIKNGTENALPLGQLRPKDNEKGFVFFSVPKESDTVYIYFYFKPGTEPVAKYEIHVKDIMTKTPENESKPEDKK